ncbi:MAG: sialidase family protein, partial [Chloroflexota bacterium]|nr:sialidase family protein [Chloroflexota bacterium]
MKMNGCKDSLVAPFAAWATTLVMVLALLVCSLGRAASLAQAQALEQEWSEPVLLSEEPWFGWFPDMAVDNLGRVHVFWEAPDFSRWRLGAENTILYPFGLVHRVWDGHEWSEQNDVIAYMGTEGIIFRLATAADANGYIYLTYSRDGVNFSKALSENAGLAPAWSAPHNMSDAIYMSDIAVDSKGVIHVVYEETVTDPLDESLLSSETPLRSAVLVHAEIYYRRSEDGGKTWTAPLNLSKTLEGTARVRLEIDGQDTLYASWEVGWSRWGGSGAEPHSGVIVASFDGGQSWNKLTEFTEPENTNAQITTAGDGQGGVLVVWRAWTTDDIYYAWST